MTADPREVADLIRTHKPQLVLLDLVLPKTDGIELMQSIPALEDLPVIFISGYGRDETIATALELGAADYIVKSFSPTDLTARIRAAPAQEGRSGAFRTRRSGHPLRATPGEPGRAGGAVGGQDSNRSACSRSTRWASQFAPNAKGKRLRYKSSSVMALKYLLPGPKRHVSVMLSRYYPRARM